jgi:hypothetical protein
MPVTQPPAGRIEVSDPNNVPELFVSGPFNVMSAGGMVHLTFTTARPNANDIFQGSTAPQFQATVTCRLLMPLEMAQQLTRTLADSLIKASQVPPATPQTVAKPADKSGNFADRRFSDSARWGLVGSALFIPGIRFQLGWCEGRGMLSSLILRTQVA